MTELCECAPLDKKYYPKECNKRAKFRIRKRHNFLTKGRWHNYCSLSHMEGMFGFSRLENPIFEIQEIEQ